MGDQAPAITMWFNDNDEGDIITQSVSVPTGSTHRNSYFMTLGWNSGSEGAGYCGIQDGGPTRHNTIFSVWDSQTVNQQIYLTHLGHGTTHQKFGGEGHGMNTMNPGYNWKINQWYTLVVRRWGYGNYTNIGMWIHDHTGNKWFHHATLGYPVPNIYFKGSTSSFVEDWSYDGAYGRAAYYKNGYKRKRDGTWIPFTSANFHAYGGTAHANSYDARAVNGNSFYLATGDGVTPTVSKTGTLNLDATRIPRQPSDLRLSFSITSATSTHASWYVPESSTPQFFYNVKVDGHSVAYGVGPEVRSVNFNHPGSTLEIELEDVLGRHTSQTHHISRL